MLEPDRDLYPVTRTVVAFMLLPAIWVWFRPTVAAFATWAIAGVIAGGLYLEDGLPVRHPWEITPWRVMVGAMCAALDATVVGAIIMAFAAHKARYGQFAARHASDL